MPRLSEGGPAPTCRGQNGDRDRRLAAGGRAADRRAHIRGVHAGQPGRRGDLAARRVQRFNWSLATGSLDLRSSFAPRLSFAAGHWSFDLAESCAGKKLSTPKYNSTTCRNEQVAAFSEVYV